MKIQILSDLHLEFLSPSQMDRIVHSIEPRGDVLALVGDIGNAMEDHYSYFLAQMATLFPKVFVVAGNHEYYGNDIETTNNTIRTICSMFSNVSFLCSSWEDYGGFRWIGTTLWSYVKETTKCFTNDIRYIQNMPLKNYNLRHRDAVEFLTTTLEASLDQSCIVMTHYLPSMSLINAKYKTIEDEPFNQWFASSLDHLIEGHTNHLPLWIYGHTHDASQTRMFQTEMVCNPLGYEGENSYPNFNLIVEKSL